MKSFTTLYPKILAACLFLAMIISLGITGHRILSEDRQSTVDVVASAHEMETLALESGLSTPQLWQKLKKEVGISSVALEEDAIDTLVQSGDITLLSGYEILSARRLGLPLQDLDLRQASINADYQYLMLRPSSADRVIRHLTATLGQTCVHRLSPTLISVAHRRDDLLKVGVGISETKAKALIAHGFAVIPRFKSSAAITPDIFRIKLADLTALTQIHTLIFEGDRVIGYPVSLGPIAKQIREKGYLFGHIEFAEQLGADPLAAFMIPSVIRVHSMTESEMLVVPQKDAFSRYLRATKERKIRLLFLHPYPSSDQPKDSLLTYNLHYFGSIVTALKDANFKVEALTESGLETYPSPSPFNVLILSWGIAAAGLILLGYFVTLKGSVKNLIFLLTGIAILFCAAWVMHQFLLWTRLAALGAAIIFPTLGVIYAWHQARHKPAWQLVLSAAGITGAGVLLGTALLDQPAFLLGVRHFMGIKLAFLFPLAAVWIYTFIRPERLTGWRAIVQRIAAAPLSLGLFLAILVATALGGLYLIRSGNASPATVSGIETHLRQLLETWLTVRPRTKEFLIGYPALYVSLVYAKSLSTHRWGWILPVIGTISMISLFNSFCHLHTPFWISAVRSLLGMGIGLVIGMALTRLIRTSIRYVNR